MNAYDLVERIGAAILSNKVRHPETGVLLAQFEGAELVLTAEGQELADSLPAKTTRARKAAAVESAPAASDASEASAPEEAPSAPETAPE